MSWNDPARVEMLKRLWASGLTASQVAAKLGGVTRNSVISKVHRLGLPARETSNQRIRRSKKRKPMPATTQSRVDKVRAIIADGLPIPPPAEFDVPRIATVDLESHHCRFPCVHDVKEVGPYAPIFCGLKPVVAGAPYCEVHLKRSWVPIRPRTPPGVSAPAPVVVRNELEAA